MRRLGGKLKVPRKSHAKKDQAKADAFKAELPARLTAVVGAAPHSPVRLWVLDEHRYGRLPVIRRVWARRGVRVHAPYATRYKWGYLHEALEIDGANRALHVVIADQAGFQIRQTLALRSKVYS